MVKQMFLSINPTGDYTVAAWFKQEGENSDEVDGINNDYQSIGPSRSVSGKTVHGYMMYLKQVLMFLVIG